MSPLSGPVQRIAGAPGRAVAWGMPWRRGEVEASAGFRLGGVPVQSWPLATWPDGSLKWSGTPWPGCPTVSTASRSATRTGRMRP